MRHRVHRPDWYQSFGDKSCLNFQITSTLKDRFYLLVVYLTILSVAMYTVEWFDDYKITHWHAQRRQQPWPDLGQYPKFSSRIWGKPRQSLKTRGLSNAFFNLLATDFFSNFSTPVFKMWVIQKPNKVALWNKRHFEEEKMEVIQHV